MRRNEGRETITELINWDRGQSASERLAGKILEAEGFKDIDPSHPAGGPDGGKDFLCSFNESQWIAAVYFPRGAKAFSDVKSKFKHDLSGVEKNKACGMAFITNQELTISNRKELEGLADGVDVRIYHLERIANLLDLPKMYGVRLEFLDIEMSKEEQLSYFNSLQEQQFYSISKQLEDLKQHVITYTSKNKVFEDEEARTLDEVCEAENMFYEKIWLDRHLSLEYRVKQLGKKIDPKIWMDAQKAATELIEKYGEENVGPYSDFEWGMLNGKLSALRWVLGCEWDMLDT